MQNKGVRVDTEYVKKLEETINEKKLGLFPYTLQTYKEREINCKVCKGKGLLKKTEVKCTDCSGTGRIIKRSELKKPLKVWAGPFNPNSPSATVEWFESKGIQLRDRVGKPSTNKLVVQAKLEKCLKPYGAVFDPEAATLIVEGDEDLTLPEELDTLLRLAQKQCAGKGLKSWFDQTYVVNNRIHSRFNPVGTSTSRLSSARPNNTNIPRVGFGREVRRAYVAEPGCTVVKADYSQLEFRMCLWFAGVDPGRSDGAFERLVEDSNSVIEGGLNAIAKARSGTLTGRDFAKSLVHAGDYLEGISLKTKYELSSSVTCGDRSAGALLVYDGGDLPVWSFRGRTVTFTGGNLSERLFGDRRRENRKKALALQELYLKHFPEIRLWHQKLSQVIENADHVRLPNGHRVSLYGRSPEDDLKFSVALHGQGGGAIYAQEGMLRFDDRKFVMNLQVHDECVFFDIPARESDNFCLNFMSPMVWPSQILPDFSCPAKVKRGPNWLDMKELGTIRC
jgi:hypothetical protein